MIFIDVYTRQRKDTLIWDSKIVDKVLLYRYEFQRSDFILYMVVHGKQIGKQIGVMTVIVKYIE